MSPRSPNPFINREASWLEFNSRVLEEAQDPKNPLLERLRFYFIFYSNLDEFFMVRVASVLRRIGEGDASPGPRPGLTPLQELEQVNAKVRALEAAAEALYEQEPLPALAKEKILVLDAAQLSPAHQQYLDSAFERESTPSSPLSRSIPGGRSPSGRAGAALGRPAGARRGGGRAGAPARPAAGPGTHARAAAVAREQRHRAVLARRRCAQARVGTVFRVPGRGGRRLPADARLELDLDDEGYRDYVRTLELELKKRAKAQPIRLECERSMSAELLGRIENGLGVSPSGLFSVQRPLEPRALLALVDLAGYDKLRYPPNPR